MVRTDSSAASGVASGEPPTQVFYDTFLRDSKQAIVETPIFARDIRIADTHAHLDMLHNPGLVLARAAANNVDFIVSVVDPTEDPGYTLQNLERWQREAIEILERWGAGRSDGVSAPPPPDVVVMIGCHPHNASSYNQAVEDEMKLALTTDTRVVGIGEIGLDYHYNHSLRETQQEVFRRQIRLAHELQSTITLHLREAHEDGFRILMEEGLPSKGLLLHCFNLDYATLEPFLERGALVAFGGPLTFKKSNDVRGAAARAHLDRLVTETDCPYMAPVPVRGAICEPASVVFVAKTLEELRDEPRALKQVYANARRFFT